MEKRSSQPQKTQVITIGGKGSSLSSASVFSVASNLAQVRIDSSISEKSKNQNRKIVAKYKLSLPETLTPEESRASLILLLSKLINSGSISVEIPNLICGRLNDSSLGDIEFDVSEEERELVDACSSVSLLDGICALLDYGATTLSPMAEAIAALSIEASSTKLSVSVFNNLVDSGDGKCVKDEAGVAGDLKVMLNGSSNLLLGSGGNRKVEGDGAIVERVFSLVPQVYGSLREAARAVHSRARSALNSGLKGGVSGDGKAWEATLVSLAAALRNVGEASLERVKLNIQSVGSEGLRSSLTHFIEDENDCPSVKGLRNVFKLASDAALDGQYVPFAHYVNDLFRLVNTVVSREMASAVIVLLEGSNAPKAEANNEKKKSDKKKKALGKGTNVFVQLIKDMVGLPDALDNVDSLRKLAGDLQAFLDPKVPVFVDFSEKVKEVVESNESRRLPKLPKGTRDFAKEQMTVREKAFSIITEVFKRHGAMALDTPVFELRETLMGKYGEDSKLIYDLADQGGELCSLRYDLTVPFARYVAMNSLTSFKRYQVAKVYRRDNPSKGRFREFYQCDFDIAGQFDKMGPDFEVVKILTELLDELNIGDYEVKLNHRKLLDGLLDICGVPAEKFRTICSSVDKLDKQSFDQVKKEMVEEKGLTPETADRIGSFVKERGSPLELLSKLKQEESEFQKHEGSAQALNELEIMFKALEKSKSLDKIVFDLSLARGLDYYTGVIFEAVFKGTTQVGSIAAGGRYDNLIGLFGSKQVPAVGVSLGIERVFAIMEQNQKDQNQVIRANETQVLVGVMGDDLSLAAELVSELWAAKIKSEYTLVKKVVKIFERAEASAIPFAVMVGERELNAGVIKVRDVKVKKEETVPRERMVEELQNRIRNSSE